MRDKWYGDNRDLVKWGIILHIAREHHLARILHVAYLRPTNWGSLEVDGALRPIPEEVIAHFRRVKNITRLCAVPRIEVIESPFVDRSIYLLELIAAIRRVPPERSLIFLDPDTGLEPRKPSLDHVLQIELQNIWAEMPADSVLVFFQHQTNQAGQPWVEAKREQFEGTLGVAKGSVKLAWGPQVARDVAFFYCAKGDAQGVGSAA